MGLDVYVGSLTRYYSGDWETIIQSLAHEGGVPVVIERVETRPNTWGALGRLLRLFRVPSPFRSSSGADRVTDPAAVRAGIIAWRAALTNTLGNDLSGALDWDESDESLYFTDKPTWDGYAALALLAAHAEHPEFAWPEEVPEHWDQDPAWIASTAEGSRTRYRQILTPELWLPGAFEFVFLA